MEPYRPQKLIVNGLASLKNNKYAPSCYSDQVSSISSYRCKRKNHVEKQRDTIIPFCASNLMQSIISSKEKDIEREIHQSITCCKQSLAECKEKLSLTLDQACPLLNATRKMIDLNTTRTLLLAWTRFKSKLHEEMMERAAAVILQSKCRSRIAKQQFNLTTKTLVTIQCFVRMLIARRHLRGLKKRRRDAMLVREQVVRAYVACCQRRKRKEERTHGDGEREGYPCTCRTVQTEKVVRIGAKSGNNMSSSCSSFLCQAAVATGVSRGRGDVHYLIRGSVISVVPVHSSRTTPKAKAMSNPRI